MRKELTAENNKADGYVFMGNWCTDRFECSNCGGRGGRKKTVTHRKSCLTGIRLAEEMVAEDKKATDTKNSKLVSILKKETKELKVQFVAMRKQFASDEYDRFAKYFDLHDESEWMKLDPKAVVERNYGDKTPYFCYTTSKLYNKVQGIKRMGKKEMVAREVKFAKEHYEMSIIKLANRIEKKDMNQNKIKTTSSHVGVNFETILTDGEKTVRAWTIIASGPVQCPHYRYLVK